MIQEYAFSYHQLTIDKSYLAGMLGFPDGFLPEPFDEYVAEALKESEKLCDIQAAFFFSETGQLAPDNLHILIDGVEFKVGKTVAKEFRESERFALFICTAGKGISQRSKELMAGENPVLGYVYDVLGSMIVEAATDELQKEVQRIAQTLDLKITNRYSPGYCKWSVADQHKLFSFFPENCCGISLTDSALMNPIKSVSGIIGLGRAVKFREYTCELCTQVDCFHRNHQHRKSQNADIENQ
jgi:hypothetical protein